MTQWHRDSVRRWAMGLTPLGVLQPQKEGHEKPATAKGRPEERSLLTATGLSPLSRKAALRAALRAAQYGRVDTHS